MARGGYRAGAGRPRGTPSKASKKEMREIKKEACKEGMTPLEYMLAIMNDNSSDSDRRDKMAISAAPYVHARADVQKLGKKEQAVAEANSPDNFYSDPLSRLKVVSDNTK